jgi:hypothetical protein
LACETVRPDFPPFYDDPTATVEFAVHQLALAFVQRSHLIEQRPVTFPKTSPIFASRSAGHGQVEIPAERSEGTKALRWWAAGPSRSRRSNLRVGRRAHPPRNPTPQARTPGLYEPTRRRSRRRTLWLLRKTTAAAASNCCTNATSADLFQMKFHVVLLDGRSIAIDYEHAPYLFVELVVKAKPFV